MSEGGRARAAIAPFHAAARHAAAPRRGRPTHARTHHVLPVAGGEDEDDPLQMMLDTKKKREQTDEEMRVRVDEDVERMMENGVKINPSASNVKTRRLGSGRVGHPWREAPSHSRVAALQGSRAELGALGPRSAALEPLRAAAKHAGST